MLSLIRLPRGVNGWGVPTGVWYSRCKGAANKIEKKSASRKKIDMKKNLYDRASTLAVKCAAELHSTVIDGRFYHVTEQFDAVHNLIYQELDKDAARIQNLEEEVERLRTRSSRTKTRGSAYQTNSTRSKTLVASSVA